RLSLVLITESSQLIWKLRCQCAIGRYGEPPTVPEVHNRWVSCINKCLEIDRNLTNREKHG
ncbi:hypothetical protein C8R47DRAFT_950290, partial [Mycena vitilis]